MIRKLLLVVLVACAAWPAMAAESAPVRSDRVEATLVTDVDAVQSGTPFHVGLRLRIKAGWHTYWSNPGDAGAPPDLTVQAGPGTQVGAIAWPVPQRLPEGPVMTYGYVNEVVLPVTITPGAGPLTVQAAASWLVCEKICVPEEGTFNLTLPEAAPAPSAEAPLLASALARVPRPSPFEAHIAPDGTLSLSGTGLSSRTVRDAWFFPAEWGPVEQAASQAVSVEDGAVRIALRPGSGFKADMPLAGVVVLRDPGGQESYLQTLASPAPAAARPAMPLGQAMLFGLLGGLILNLMPCVFPILAMKAVAISRLSGGDRRNIRMHAAFYTLGVLLAFAGLGGALVALRAAGLAAGWGFQFQSPVFVAAMAWVLFVVGLNLSGVFQIGTSLAGAGQGLTESRGYTGSVFTGLLAVLVATPCTAPFMGAAIAAALAAPAAFTLAVFLSMGLGLAAPYVLLAVIPRLARLLPRPGAWMDVFKSILAFPMYGAAVWLLWVVSLQAGPDGVLVTAAGMVMLAFSGWALGLAQTYGRPAGYAAALVGAVLAAGMLPTLGSASPLVAAAASDSEPYSPARLDALRSAGRPIFVNMTAAWCVTCLVNERVALSPTRVRQAFAAGNVAYLKGDWTRADPVITAFLKQHARDGVPLYVYYPASGAEPTILPQILTEAEVLSHIGKNGG